MEIIYRYTDIRHLHIEPTTRCNAACPMCGRNALGVTRSSLPLLELSRDDILRLLPTELITQLDAIDFCGAYGDPAVARELAEIVAGIRELNPQIRIEIFSNGSVRTPSWWAELAAILGENGQVVFAIDGLEDSNHIYRQGTEFNRIVDNARAFISHGGRAQWDYIVFRHNESEVDMARALSEKLGFETFNVKASGRFFKRIYETDPCLEPNEGFDSYPIHDRRGHLVGQLRPPHDPRYKNPSVRLLATQRHGYEGFRPHLEAARIRCKVQETQSLFIAADGTVYPCCWLYNQSNYPELYGITGNDDSGVAELVAATGGRAEISAFERPLRDIVEGSFFQGICSSWSSRSFSCGKLKVCARVCGDYVQQYTDQFVNKSGIPGQTVSRQGL